MAQQLFCTMYALYIYIGSLSTQAVLAIAHYDTTMIGFESYMSVNNVTSLEVPRHFTPNSNIEHHRDI